jgi:hypothetical protein
MSLTVAYMTNRRDNRIQWFFDSLLRQAGPGFLNINVVVVDFFVDERDPVDDPNVKFVSPKPNPWQGKYRLTSRDYFAAANARNTAICYAPDGHIAFVDDISVLMPNWLKYVYKAMATNHVVLGRYAKVLELEVTNGQITRYTPNPKGEDSRYNPAAGDNCIRVSGGWMYGASLVAPVEAFLKINGWDEDCDSMGSEDYIAGIMLEKNGYEIFYHQGMMTLESEELHHAEPAFARVIKPRIPGKSTFTERDASHAILRMVEDRGRHKAPNTFNLRELRQHILAGREFPTDVHPQHDWRDGQPLQEM